MIPLYKVYMPSDILKYLDPVLKSGFITQGPKEKEFASLFQEWVGNENIALVNSGTSALTLALRLSGVSFGDEVISSPLTCLATNEPVHSLGGKIVWCDIDEKTGNISPNEIEKLITNKTKAILFVDWAGTPAELDEINKIAEKYNLKTIEDSAHSLGAIYKEKKIGSCCDFTCFSFQAIKHLTTVDGGALACKNKDDYERAKLLRWFGLERNHNKSPVCWEGDVPEYGYKFHMNDMNATIGIEQLKTIDKRVAAHRENGYHLLTELGSLETIKTTIIPSYIKSSFWIFTILLEDKAHREFISNSLVSLGIGNNITHTRNDAYSLFSYAGSKSLKVLDNFSNRMLNVPCGWWLSINDLNYIVENLKGLDSQWKLIKKKQ